MPYSLEIAELTLTDFVWKVGGIVSIYLGVSLIVLFDIIDQVCSNFACKAFLRRNEVHNEKH